MADGAILIVDPMQELPEVLGQFEDRLRWAVADTDEEFWQIEAVAEDVGTLACLLLANRCPPLLAPDGAELARVSTLPPSWRLTVHGYARTRLTRLAPYVPDGAVAAFGQLARCAVWSARPDAELLRGTLGRSDRRLTMVEYEAYTGLVHVTLADPLARWAALGPTSPRFACLLGKNGVPGRQGRPDWRL